MSQTQSPSEKALLTIPEAAKVLGIARTSAYEAVRRGELPALHVGKRVYVPRAQLEAWVGEKEQQPQTIEHRVAIKEMLTSMAECMKLIERIYGDPS